MSTRMLIVSLQAILGCPANASTQLEIDKTAGSHLPAACRNLFLQSDCVPVLLQPTTLIIPVRLTP